MKLLRNRNHLLKQWTFQSFSTGKFYFDDHKILHLKHREMRNGNFDFLISTKLNPSNAIINPYAMPCCHSPGECNCDVRDGGKLSLIVIISY